MIELTKAEEQVMQYLWNIDKGFLKDIVEQYPEPKPAYTTVSTVVRVLVKKKAIGFNTYGKVNEYFPLIKKTAYSKRYMTNLVQNFFNNSQQQFASFFTKESDLSVSELEELKALIDQKISDKKK
ncbi:BlaI/MecI/CopY family transcriptional regulator [Carboxylicivirga marina]|uniref:BlaI/MecI/CopY family transcriptional regulator n=1 Tax=Carboxylicivirga marina TaxID=2800988 RepID=A0ABS1HHA1_9BACT|nr:BlaI/MecI/CopY family transcriptional regulator [Carboxylicivirga marina]MBK3517060.1 BlaI/MecI/CopY family transcriptional regulator [Carboxylicivirga marina]